MNTSHTVKRLPKIDLHRHLEATIRLDTAREIAKEFHLDLPWRHKEAFRRCFQFTSDDDRTGSSFLSHFHKEIWVTEDVIKRVATEAIEDAKKDNLVYLELRFSADHQRKHYDHSIERIVEIYSNVIENAPVKTNLIMFISPGRTQTYEYVEPNLAILREISTTKSSVPIVGVDLAQGLYDDRRLFERVLNEVRDLDYFPLTIHAGEGRSASGIKQAIEQCGGSRIGHGIGSWYDKEVLDLVVRRNIPLEVCVTSNFQTGAVPSLKEHPAHKLLMAGAVVTLNTDDPSISNDLTMSDEYEVAVETLGFSYEDLRQVLINSVEAAFVPKHEKEDLRNEALFLFDSTLADKG